MLSTVYPPLEIAVEFAIEDEEITLVKRGDGTGRLRWEGEQDLHGRAVSLHGQESVFRWKRQYDRAVAVFNAEQMAAIIGE